MDYVQVVLTTDHVADLREGLDNIVVPPEEEAPGRAARLQILGAFLDRVMETPQAFPVTGQMATAIKTRMRKLKGPTQPPRKNKRKQRQEKRMTFAKRRRQERRQTVEDFNRAQRIFEEERREIEGLWAEQDKRATELLAQQRLGHEELIELFGLLGLAPLILKAQDAYEREHNPQAVLDRL